MKFINYLSTIAGVDIFPLISLMIFFLFFIGLIWYVLQTDKQEMVRLKSIPLDQRLPESEKDEFKN
ncbi:MAG: CcoQ/FixQ family Cbb3-type cytochrome c oxidase assembly chaperone [Bacteroidia bacterium]|nr:CcoQ/FixQ family Cbb3-type cytochrome c oxidase assembly chaperone [Bacteroidia bacterium]MCC6768175.1 CcoQ/FixQ family Cbb3-type cytochrome c oxidase assembly chaperone [Bacteroidia bacterium]